MKHNPAIPDKSLLFKPVEDVYGNRLALEFGNEYDKGECPFYQKQCYHCEIGSGEGIQFNYEMNKQRLDFFKDYYKDNLPDSAHLLIYNHGSVLNPEETSAQTLKEILDYISSLETCKVISFETRELFVNNKNLDYILENLREDQQARIILGVESQDDDTRLRKLKKNMGKKNIEKAFNIIGNYNGKIGVDFSIVFQPPELKDEKAIEEAVKTAEYGLDLSEKYNVPVDFNFHSFYPTKKSIKEYPDHPRANLKDGFKALIRIKESIIERNSDAMIFIGWQDEVYDIEQEKKIKELEKYKDIFNYFNINQKF